MVVDPRGGRYRRRVAGRERPQADAGTGRETANRRLNFAAKLRHLLFCLTFDPVPG